MIRSRLVLTMLIGVTILSLGIPLALIVMRRAIAAPAVPLSGVVPSAVSEVRPIQLTNHLGELFGTSNLQGKVALLYFGYTFCPDICPTELGYLAKVMRGLGEDAAQVVPVFISVDPERDSQQVLAEYVPLFDSRLVGLHGSPAEIAAVAKSYGIMHQKTNVVTKQASYYLIDHTSTIFVLDRHGRIADTLDSDTSIEVAVARLRRLLR